MLSPTTVVQFGKISQYLAAVAIAKNIEQDKRLARKIYIERKYIEWELANNPTNTSLTDTANYLISICGNYFLKAQGIAGQGGSVITPSAGALVVPYELNVAITLAESGVPTYTDANLISANPPSTIFVNQTPMLLWNGVSGQWTFDSTFGTIDFSIGDFGLLQTGARITGTFFKIS